MDKMLIQKAFGFIKVAFCFLPNIYIIIQIINLITRKTAPISDILLLFVLLLFMMAMAIYLQNVLDVAMLRCIEWYEKLKREW
jgi:hypothetical protein